LKGYGQFSSEYREKKVPDGPWRSGDHQIKEKILLPEKEPPPEMRRSVTHPFSGRLRRVIQLSWGKENPLFCRAEEGGKSDDPGSLLEMSEKRSRVGIAVAKSIKDAT